MKPRVKLAKCFQLNLESKPNGREGQASIDSVKIRRELLTSANSQQTCDMFSGPFSPIGTPSNSKFGRNTLQSFKPSNRNYSPIKTM